MEYENTDVNSSVLVVVVLKVIASNTRSFHPVERTEILRDIEKKS